MITRKPDRASTLAMSRAAWLCAISLLGACSTTQIPYYSRTGLPPEEAAKAAVAPSPAAADETSASSVQAAQGAPLEGGIGAAAATDASRSAPIPEFPIAIAVTPTELRFQVGDSVKVSIWGYPELDHIAVVQPNGRIQLPLVGEIEAAGATHAELRDRITERLAPFTQVAAAELRPGDTLTLEVWQQAELRYTAVIEPGGMATFPLAGRVQASGRSVEDIRKEIESRLLVYLRDARVSVLPVYNNRRVLHDVHVSVLATQLEPRRVAVMGEVGNPGIAEIRGSLRLVDAIARAQLRDATAELNGVVVIRNSDTNRPAYRVLRLRDYFAGTAPDQNIYLQNADVVIVPKSMIAKVDEFVDLFFTRTAPIFNWWFAAFEAASTKARFDSIRLINEALRRQLTAVSVSPP